MKKIIRLKESDFYKFISNSVKKILNEQDFGTLNIDNISEITVKFVGRNEIKENVDLLWDMLTLSYTEIGGLKTYRNKEQFEKMAKYAKLAYENDNIVACAIYRNVEDSYKMVAIGCNQDYNGKEGIKAIVKDDIRQSDFHFWAEVSGAIEHYFKKYNGYPMPNTLASEILNVSKDNLRISNKDFVHYERIISGEWFEKMIFGIKSDEIYKEAIAAVDDYASFMKDVDNINEKSQEGLRFSLKQAYYIIENILRAHEEDGFNELVPSWHKALLDALQTLKHSKQNRTVKDYIDYCNYLLNDMTVLKLHKLNL